MSDKQNGIEEQNAEGKQNGTKQKGMKKHNEVNKAMESLKKSTKALNVVFILGIVLCALSMVSPLLAWCANALGLTTYVLDFEFMWPTFLFNALQYGVYVVVFALCLSVSRYISKGRSPFSCKLARRMDVAGILLLSFFVVCLLWNPIFSLINPLNASWNIETGTYEDFASPFLNYPILIISIIAFLTAHALRYGDVLQSLSDDTV